MGGLFGGDEQIIIPTKQIITGGEVAEKATVSLDEKTGVKKTARSVARTGTTKYRIPLASQKAGAKISGGGSGLTI